MDRVYKSKVTEMFYIISEKVGTSLKRYIKVFDHDLSLPKIFHIGLQLISIFSKLQDHGLSLQTLDPSHILIGRVPYIEDEAFRGFPYSCLNRRGLYLINFS